VRELRPQAAADADGAEGHRAQPAPGPGRWRDRVSPDGDLLTPATDVDHPEVIDDAVDEVIETVLHRGGWVALLDDGALAGHDRIALTTRAR
jgi:hypothetical protein